jgi:hypothetical protein
MPEIRCELTKYGIFTAGKFPNLVDHIYREAIGRYGEASFSLLNIRRPADEV